MQIFRVLAGYSYGRADVVRRAMSKKKKDVMEAERKTFIEGCGKNNILRDTANAIFDQMSEFAKYAFNKSHAACYALVAYRTAYLKHIILRSLWRHFSPPCLILQIRLRVTRQSAKDSA